MSFQELVTRSLEDAEFAAELCDVVTQAGTNPVSALSQLQGVFALTPDELNKLGYTEEDLERLDAACTVPTRTYLTAYATFLPAAGS